MGLLDQLGNLGNAATDPENQAQLGLISGLFAAGAPSRMPVSIGQGFSSAVQGANQGLKQGYETQQMRLNNLMLQQKMKMFQDYLSNGQPQENTPYGSQQDALTSGASQGDIGPTVTNAARVQSQDSGGIAGLLNDPNYQVLTHKIMQANLLGIPADAEKITLQALASNYGLTPEQKNIGFLPKAQQEKILEFSANKPVNIRQFGYMDAYGPHSLPMNAPGGTMPMADPTQPTGYSYVGIGGAQEAIAREKAAELVGSGKGVDSKGNPVPINFSFGNPSAPKTNYPPNRSPVISNKGSGVYGAPPLGKVQSTNAAESAPSEQMAKQQQTLVDADNVYQQSREALQNMIKSAEGANYKTTATRLLPGSMATRISSDAAEYEKNHSNFIALQGKALGAGGTDQARANIEHSVPDYTKPQEAKLDGLNIQLNQLDLQHLKRQVLSNIYQGGDEKNYTSVSSQFDSNFKPSMMPQINQVISMPPGPARGQLLSDIAKDPQMKNALNILVKQGLLK